MTLRSTTGCTCRRDLESSHVRWDFHMFRALCFQGGGVFVSRGTVSFSSCTITGNSAGYVRAHVQNFPSPRGEVADMPKSTLIFRFGLIFGSIRDLYVPATHANFPSPPWETHVLLVFTGLRCLCPGWHGDLLTVHHHWQHSF